MELDLNMNFKIIPNFEFYKGISLNNVSEDSKDKIREYLCQNCNLISLYEIRKCINCSLKICIGCLKSLKFQCKCKENQYRENEKNTNDNTNNSDDEEETNDKNFIQTEPLTNEEKTILGQFKIITKCGCPENSFRQFNEVLDHILECKYLKWKCRNVNCEYTTTREDLLLNDEYKNHIKVHSFKYKIENILEVIGTTHSYSDKASNLLKRKRERNYKHWKKNKSLIDKESSVYYNEIDSFLDNKQEEQLFNKFITGKITNKEIKELASKYDIKPEQDQFTLVFAYLATMSVLRNYFQQGKMFLIPSDLLNIISKIYLIDLSDTNNNKDNNIEKLKKFLFIDNFNKEYFDNADCYYSKQFIENLVNYNNKSLQLLKKLDFIQLTNIANFLKIPTFNFKTNIKRIKRKDLLIKLIIEGIHDENEYNKINEKYNFDSYHFNEKEIE